MCRVLGLRRRRSRPDASHLARLGARQDAQEVYNALFEGKSVQRCLIDLLSREQKDELAGFGEFLLVRDKPA